MLTVICIILASAAVFTTGVFALFPGFHEYAGSIAVGGLDQRGESISSYMLSTADLKDSKGSPHDLMLEFPSDVNLSDIYIDEDIIGKTLTMTVRGIEDNYYLDYPLVSFGNDVADITYYASGLKGVFNINFNTYTDYNVTKEGNSLYLDFVPLKESQDNIVVIDPGHGGADTGSIFSDIREKDINLSISEFLYQELLGLDIENTRVFSTRRTDDEVSDQERIDFANELGAELFVSIHLNSTSSGRISEVSGTEVMYLYSDQTMGSKVLAEGVLKALTERLGTKNRGLVPGDDLEVLRKTEATSALAEIGFMSNEEELQRLASEDFQKEAAKAISLALLEYINGHNNSNGE